MKTRSSRFFMILLHLVGVRRRSLLSQYPSEWWWSIQPQLKTSSTAVFHKPSTIRQQQQNQQQKSSLTSRPTSTQSGIMGVHPSLIRMEQVDLAQAGEHNNPKQTSNRYSKKIKSGEPRVSSSSSSTSSYVSFTMDPIWLQDSSSFSVSPKTIGTKQCLGPNGYFCECGDTTLWSIRPTNIHIGKEVPSKHPRMFRNILRKIQHFITTHTTRRIGDSHVSKEQTDSATKDDNVVVIGWTFQAVEEQSRSNIVTPFLDEGAECLQYDRKFRSIEVKRCKRRKTKRKKRNNNNNNISRFDNVWIVNRDGLLQALPTSDDIATDVSKAVEPRSSNFDSISMTTSSPSTLCLGRDTKSHRAILVPCYNLVSMMESGSSTSHTEDDTTYEPVRFSFIRYRAVPLPMIVEKQSLDHREFSADRNIKDGRESVVSEVSNQRDHRRTPTHALGKPLEKSVGNGNGRETFGDSTQHFQSETGFMSSHPTRLSKSKTVDTKNLPSNRDIAAHRSNSNPVHPDLKLSTRIRFDDSTPKHNAQKLLYNTNPILLVSSSKSESSKVDYVRQVDANLDSRSRAITRATQEIQKVDQSVFEPPLSRRTKVVLDDSGTIPGKMLPHRLFRNPYIDAANSEGIWTDPATGLEYHTDLCEYLGWDRSERGRQTLTGVGIYRKGYVIKVYGVAFYVSNRDVLADPIFTNFAGLSSEELRKRPDFFMHLRTMGNSNRDKTSIENIGSSSRFDRTIMLKTNMQLSADTMRSSLQADWSYLTDEMKSTLVGSSMEARPADDRMLQLITSPENPSRCSCSQIAPPEYNANPECCARGTELVFTWLKNDNLEVRLNGRLMISFPRPDIAAGIFFEYLRYDDPISPEFLDRVVDGFPFLLSPLAQVKGVQIGGIDHSRIVPQSSSGDNPTNRHRSSNPFEFMFHSLVGIVDNLNHQITGLKDTILEHSENTAKLMFHATLDVLKSVDEKRTWFVNHTAGIPMTFTRILQNDEETIRPILESMIKSREWLHHVAVTSPSTLTKIFVQRDEETLQEITDFGIRLFNMLPFVTNGGPDDVIDTLDATLKKVEGIIIANNDYVRQKQQRQSLQVFGFPLSRWFSERNEFLLLHDALDEIGPMKVYPTMDSTRRIFLTFGHLYLLLLFIVSFPGSHSTTRAKHFQSSRERKRRQYSTTATTSCCSNSSFFESDDSDNDATTSSHDEDNKSSFDRENDMEDGSENALSLINPTRTAKTPLKARLRDHGGCSRLRFSTTGSMMMPSLPMSRSVPSTSSNLPQNHLLHQHNLFSQAARKVLSSARKLPLQHLQSNNDRLAKNSSDTSMFRENNQQQRINSKQLRSDKDFGSTRITKTTLSVSSTVSEPTAKTGTNSLSKKSLSYFL